MISKTRSTKKSYRKILQKMLLEKAKFKGIKITRCIIMDYTEHNEHTEIIKLLQNKALNTNKILLCN